jgi:hypothetical protein
MVMLLKFRLKKIFIMNLLYGTKLEEKLTQAKKQRIGLVFKSELLKEKYN